MPNLPRKRTLDAAIIAAGRCRNVKNGLPFESFEFVSPFHPESQCTKGENERQGKQGCADGRRCGSCLGSPSDAFHCTAIPESKTLAVRLNLAMAGLVVGGGLRGEGIADALVVA